MIAFLKDFYSGYINSIRFDLFLGLIFSNPKIRRLFKKSVLFGLLVFVANTFFDSIVSFTQERVFFLLPFLFVCFKYAFKIFSFGYQTLLQMDIVREACKNEKTKKAKESSKGKNVVNVQNSKTENNLGLFYASLLLNLVSNVVCFFSKIVFSNVWLLMFVIEFLIISLQHSYYCYYGYWRNKNLRIGHHVDIFEKMWPFFLAYSTNITLMFLLSRDHFFLFLYERYLLMCLCLPFLVTAKYPPRQTEYVKLPLKFMLPTIEWITRLSNYLISRYLSK